MFKGYDPAGEVDVHGFGGSLVVYAALLSGLGAALRAGDRELPDSFPVADVALGGIATHKLSRLMAKGAVTSPLRAPFTTFVAPAGSAEHDEEPRGDHGVRHTVGELLTCPFCLGVWLGTAYVAGLVVAPRPTRAAAAVLSVVAVSDALQQGYARLRTD